MSQGPGLSNEELKPYRSERFFIHGPIFGSDPGNCLGVSQAEKVTAWLNAEYERNCQTQSAPKGKMNRKCVYKAEYMADNRAVQVLVIASDTREAFNKVDKMADFYKKTHWGEVTKLEFIGFVEGEEY